MKIRPSSRALSTRPCNSWSKVSISSRSSSRTIEAAIRALSDGVCPLTTVDAIGQNPFSSSKLTKNLLRLSIMGKASGVKSKLLSAAFLNKELIMTTIPTEPYITSAEGERLLGVNTGRFFYYVQSGQIEREPGSTKRNARYSVKDILKVKEKLAEKQQKKARKSAVSGYVDWIISVEDVLSSLKLDYRVYGEQTP